MRETSSRPLEQARGSALQNASSPLARPMRAQALRGVSGPPRLPPATAQRSTLDAVDAQRAWLIVVSRAGDGDQVARAHQGVDARAVAAEQLGGLGRRG